MTGITYTRQLTVHRRLSDGRAVVVGQLAQNTRGTYFSYQDDYLNHYHSLSPFRLPFTSALAHAPRSPHHGLHGVFADSLPDGWGLLLMDRVFRRHGVELARVTRMDRLAYVGDRGVGALTYTPTFCTLDGPSDRETRPALVELSALGEEAELIFDGERDTALTALAAAGSSGGARPKAMLYIDHEHPTLVATAPRAGFEPWIVKFTSRSLPLGHDEGRCEAAYLAMARDAGIEVPTAQLFDGPDGRAWLAVRRFDRAPSSSPGAASGSYHVSTLCGLLDADFRQPSMDYEDLIKASQVLCRSPAAGRVQFVRAMFNLLSGNQDDHTKNWSFIMADDGAWAPSPFYDVTFSPSGHREHATAFCGHGQQPPLAAIQRLAAQASFTDWPQAKREIERVVDALGTWPTLAADLGVDPVIRRDIERHLTTLRRDSEALFAGYGGTRRALSTQ